MSGKPPRPYSSSTAPNGRGTVRAKPAPNLPAEASHTRRRRGANANLHPPVRNYVAINVNKPAPPSINALKKTIKKRLSNMRSKTPNRPHTIVNIRPNTPEPIEVVVDPMHPPNNAVLQINRPPSRPRTPNQRIKVVSHTAKSPHTRVSVRSRSRTPSGSHSKSKSKIG